MARLRLFLQLLVRFALAKPWLSVVIFFLAFISSAWYVQFLSFDSTTQSFTKESDPARQAYLQFEEQYGLSAYFIVLVRDEHLFEPDGIERLRNLHQQIEQQVPYVLTVESIINARYVSSFDDDIIIDSFIGEQQLTLDQLKNKQDQASVTPYFKQRLLSSDHKTAAIIIALSQYDENHQRLKNAIRHMSDSYAAIQDILAQHQAHYPQELLLGGSPVVGIELTKITMQEMLLFSCLALLLVSLCLYCLFRRFTAVVYPLLLLVASNVMVLAIMATLGYAVQLSSVILPSFIMAVGVADSVHFLRAFYPAYELSGDKKEAIFTALEHTGIAMFFTSLTTSVGLLSFANSTVASIANFGVFAAIGVWIAWLITMYCLPAALLLSPIKECSNSKQQQAKQVYHIVYQYVAFVYNYKKTIVAASVAVLCLALLLVSQLQFSMDILRWFKADHPIPHVNQQIESELGGVAQLELLLSRQDGQAFVLQDYQQLDKWLESVTQRQYAGLSISSATSVIELIKETHRALVPEQGYQLPQTQELLAQELLLLEFEPDSLHQLVNQDFTELRLTLSLPWLDALQFNQLSKQLEQHFDQYFAGQLQASYTGMLALTNHTFQTQIYSMLYSYILAGFVILVLFILLLKSLRLGLVVMLIPNVTPIALVLALMYILDIPLDVFSLLIGSIAIGIIVDDTIHLLQTYRDKLQLYQQPIEAMSQAFLSTGKALFFTSIILTLAFLSYSFSSLATLLNFGLLTALCIVLALLADLFILPALLFCCYSKMERH